MHKLAIVGYGKMGRMIESLAPEYGFLVHARIDVNDDMKAAQGADVALASADLALMTNDLRRLGTCIRLARRCRRTISAY